MLSRGYVARAATSIRLVLSTRRERAGRCPAPELPSATPDARPEQAPGRAITLPAVSIPIPPSPPAPTADAPASEVALEFALVALGGALGALGRAGIAALAVLADVAGPVATQIVNGAGACALGLLLSILERHGPLRRWRAFLAVGVLGAFTTYSGWIDESRRLADSTPDAIALLFLVGTLVLGIAAFELGRCLGRIRPKTGSATGDRSEETA